MVVRSIIYTIKKGSKSYDKEEELKKRKVMQMQCNFTNFNLILAKFIEFHGFLIYVLRKDVGWTISDAAETVISSPNLEASPNFNTFLPFFWLCVFVGILFIFLIFPASRRASEGHLGRNPNGTKLKVCSREFWLFQVINILAASFYSPIMSKMMEIYSCNYNVQPWVLYADSTFECFTEGHFMYLLVSLAVVCTYYPFATFIFSNLQFANKDADIKFSPSFVVLLSQVKLLVAGLNIFMRSGEIDIVMRLAILAVALTGLGVVSAKTEPCIVPRMNIYFTALYILAAWINLMAIVVRVWHAPVIALSLIGAGALTILIVSLVVHKRKYGFFFAIPEKLFM